MKILYTIYIILLCVLLCACNKNPASSEFEDDFFPLRVGMKWDYKLVNFHGAKLTDEFRVEVTGTNSINDTLYYEIENYFIPGASLPDPTCIRIDEERVFTRVNDKEYLLYSFNSADSSSWHLPMFVSPGMIYDFYTNRVELNSEEANFLWWMGKEIGRSELQWTDVFVKGIGRTKIVYSAQAASGEWELF